MGKACKKADRNRTSSKIYRAERRRERNREMRLYRTLLRQPYNYNLRIVLDAIRPDLVEKVDRIVAAKEMREAQKNV